MKKLQSAILIMLILALSFTACSCKNENLSFSNENAEKAADLTFNEIIDAIETKDASKIANMFSPVIQAEPSLLQDAKDLLDFIEGDIVSYSSASDGGVGTDQIKEDGKTTKKVQSVFTIETTQSTYHVAILECFVDEYDSNNVGILSIYIIKATDWTESYIYRGDGNWTPGINIVTN